NAIRVAKETVSHDVNRHIVEELGALGEAGGEKGDKSPRRMWQRIKSKIESFGEKPESEGEGRESKSEGKG
ncbi:MAG: hypothetical protein AABZ09_04135, partial [Candidatus Binatota bacterium]